MDIGEDFGWSGCSISRGGGGRAGGTLVAARIDGWFTALIVVVIIDGAPGGTVAHDISQADVFQEADRIHVSSRLLGECAIGMKKKEKSSAERWFHLLIEGHPNREEGVSVVSYKNIDDDKSWKICRNVWRMLERLVSERKSAWIN